MERQNPDLNGFLIDTNVSSSATTFSIINSLNMATNTSPSSLQFGDERFFYGNIDTYIGANIYKTLFGLSIDASQFQFTSNPTRATDNDSNLKVSEVGIYDNNNKEIKTPPHITWPLKGHSFYGIGIGSAKPFHY